MSAQTIPDYSATWPTCIQCHKSNPFLRDSNDQCENCRELDRMAFNARPHTTTLPTPYIASMLALPSRSGLYDDLTRWLVEYSYLGQSGECIVYASSQTEARALFVQLRYWEVVR